MTKDRRLLFSTLWVFATLNYLYCDVVTLMDPSLLRQFMNGNVRGMAVSQGFLLAAGLLVEIPMAMVVLSSLLSLRAARLANVVAGSLMTIVQLGTILAGPPAPYYAFFCAIEIATTAGIALYAWRWMAATRTEAPVAGAVTA